MEFSQLKPYKGGQGLIRIVGHRGARGVMPENTIEGFRFTLDADVQALEFDVLLSADDVPVITHNFTLSADAVRDPDGNWLSDNKTAVASLCVDELKRYDVGGVDCNSTYGAKYPDQVFLNNLRIPTLAELLELVKEPRYQNASLLLELKSDVSDSKVAVIRKKLVGQVVSLLRSYGLTDRTVMHSFDWGMLEECAQQAPEMPRSYLSEISGGKLVDSGDVAAVPDLNDPTVSLPQAVIDAGGQMWAPYFKDVTPDLVAKAHELGLPVTVWTVNKTADIEAMIKCGVDGICTDYPGRVQQLLRKHGLRWQGD